MASLFLYRGACSPLCISIFLLELNLILSFRVPTGHMAIAMMNMSLSRNLPSRIAHIILFYPVTATHIRRPSYETFREGPFLHADTMEWMIDAFLPDHRDRETALASPLTFLGDDVLARFAPTTLIMSTVDPLLDEGLEFGYRLQEAGVDASIVKAEGQMHAFVLLKGLRDNPTARAMMDLTACKLREALEISW